MAPKLRSYDRNVNNAVPSQIASLLGILSTKCMAKKKKKKKKEKKKKKKKKNLSFGKVGVSFLGPNTIRICDLIEIVDGL